DIRQFRVAIGPVAAHDLANEVERSITRAVVSHDELLRRPTLEEDRLELLGHELGTVEGTHDDRDPPDTVLPHEGGLYGSPLDDSRERGSRPPSADTMREPWPPLVRLPLPGSAS